MSELFKGYEQEFIGGLTKINTKIQSISVQTSQKKELAFVDIKQDQLECEKLIKLMETEINSIDVQVKFEFSRKVRQYKKDFDDCRKKLYKAEEEYALAKSKEMLIGAQLDEQKSSANREKLLKNGDMLSDTTYKLKNSVQVMHETEEIGNNIEVELAAHTNKMKTNKERLIVMRDDIGSSENRIASIMMRVRRNKLVLFGVLALIAIIAIIAVVVHFATRTRR